MKQKKIIKIIGIPILLFYSISWYWDYTSDYSKEMRRVRAIRESLPKNNVVDGEIEPEFPDWSENDSTVLGVDSNKNEIRDDIEVWINHSGMSEKHRRAFRQLAKSYNRMLTYCEKHMDTIEERDQISEEISKALACLTDVEIIYGENYSLENFERLFINNKERKTSGDFYVNLQHRSIDKNTLVNYCDFSLR